MKEKPVKPKRAKSNAAFQMPSVQTMVSRKSSITNAFVNSIIPVIVPSEDEVFTALRILQIDPEDLRCAYCGDKSTEWDHLRPLVSKRRPTGFISEIANLVPSCGKCNQSKGNKDWRTWMMSKAKLSPRTRGVSDLDARVQRLQEYEKWREVRPINFEAIVGGDLWSEYWQTCENVISALKKSQEFADRLRTMILNSHKKERLL